MSLAQFSETPWKTSHTIYAGSALAMKPAPEYASSEVILSSLYRVLGLPDISEPKIPANGRELDRVIQAHLNKASKPDRAVLEADTIHSLLHSVLESPKLPKQSARRFLQVTPLVPGVATFSGSARLTGNSWSPGALVRRIIWLGSTEQRQGSEVWRSLFEALAVKKQDDIFARFLQAELGSWTAGVPWSVLPGEDDTPTFDDDDLVACPARQLLRDIMSVVAAKDAMTRRQWTSLLEAVIRLGAVAHVAWTCDVHARTWACVRKAIAGGGPATQEEARQAIFPSSPAYFSYGDRALPRFTDLVSQYLSARLGLNATLWAMEAAGIKVTGGLSSSGQIAILCREIRASAPKLAEVNVAKLVAEISDRENHRLLCRKGIGSNILEFVRHALGQRQAANPILRGYDQGYALRKKSAASSSPWVVGLGPVSVLAMVHCSLAESAGPRSVRRLAQHLAAYGLIVDYREIATNDLGHQLRMLGLVLDSPDAESGMLLVPPFALQRHAGTT